MKTHLIKFALRNNALFIPQEWTIHEGSAQMSETTGVLLANCAKLGFTFSEELLHRINGVTPVRKLDIFEFLKEVTGVEKNWTPLVKQWNVPTGESVIDHIITFFANKFQVNTGTHLACGHVIPEHTFPIERYNGCPFCGTPFEFEKLELALSVNKLKVLELWTETDLQRNFTALLKSPVALDATQVDSLKILLANFDYDPNTEIAMKETVMTVVDELVKQGKQQTAGTLFGSANDILRYLWYGHTGFLQIIEPKVLVNRIARNSAHIHAPLNKGNSAGVAARAALKLKFTRAECKLYAGWLNAVAADAERQCGLMHPKRGIWVRVIRALRLAEYSKVKGFENLARLLDLFYNETYEVWSGNVHRFKLKMDAEKTFGLLKQRPGLFARSLFSTMLWFGPEITLKHFSEVLDEVPKRLIFSLNMYAETYFARNTSRVVKPLGGTSKHIPGNKLVNLFTDEELKAMETAVQELSLEVIKRGLAKAGNPNRTIFIEEGLNNIPLAIGDRNDQVQDLPNALMGTRFPVEGTTVRLFMQWGEGLPKQHMDMDLSCAVAYHDKTELCYFGQLAVTGCKHSGDIRQIPANVGTAEYIDIDLAVLRMNGAKYVTFTCNAYSNGSITPNLTAGWMNSASPMRITSNGVAYDPTAVQHQVRITQQLTKGLAFGVIDVKKNEVIWLEMSFGGQVVQNMSTKAVEALMQKLEAKLKIGDLLKLKAAVQNLTVVEDSAWQMKSTT